MVAPPGPARQCSSAWAGPREAPNERRPPQEAPKMATSSENVRILICATLQSLLERNRGAWDARPLCPHSMPSTSARRRGAMRSRACTAVPQSILDRRHATVRTRASMRRRGPVRRVAVPPNRFFALNRNHPLGRPATARSPHAGSAPAGSCTSKRTTRPERRSPLSLYALTTVCRRSSGMSSSITAISRWCWKVVEDDGDDTVDAQSSTKDIVASGASLHAYPQAFLGSPAVLVLGTRPQYGFRYLCYRC